MSPICIDNHLLHIDDHFIVLNKPAGLRVIPDGYDPSLPNLRGLLNNQFERVWVLHRLDKETSGVILFARDAETHRALNLQFQKREVQKQYHLIIIGTPPWKTATALYPLCTNGDRKHRTVVAPQNGKPAQTDFSVIRSFSFHSLLTAQPHSGYTHQIRGHISSRGFPILGDRLYWKASAHKTSSSSPKQPPKTSHLISRVGLHAHTITFCDPYTNKLCTFSANYPTDFINCLNKIADL